MGMTRADIILMCRDTLGEDMSSPEGGNPGAWNRLVTTAADEVARASWCLYTLAAAPITANQAEYCAPSIFELQAASIYYPDGKRHTLSMETFAAMDDQGSGWRDNPPGEPAVLIASGLNQFVLYPTPSYDSNVHFYADLAIGVDTSKVSSVLRPFLLADVGLQLWISGGTGFTTGVYWVTAVDAGVATLSNVPEGPPVSVGATLSTGGLASLTSGGMILEGWGTTVTTPGYPGDWSAQTALCPLPERAHMAVVYKACLLRILRNPTNDNMLRQPGIMAEYRSELGRLQVEVKRWTHATREPAYTGGGYGGSALAGPLDDWS
jgi:hypothetical protein